MTSNRVGRAAWLVALAVTLIGLGIGLGMNRLRREGGRV
jgi:hypothetical protein